MDEVLLRPIQEADLVDLCRYSTDPEAAGEFEWTGFTDPKAMRRRWEEDGWLGPNGRLAVVSADSLAGDVSYRDRSPAASTRAIYEIGIALFPEHRGQGVGTIAQRLLVQYLFDTTPAHRLEAYTEVANTAEQRALEKIGLSVRVSCGGPSSGLGSGATTSCTRCSDTDGQIQQTVGVPAVDLLSHAESTTSRGSHRGRHAAPDLPDTRYRDQCRTQRQNIVVPKAASTLPTALCRRAIAIVDLSGRAKKSSTESSTRTDGSPSTARTGGAMRSRALMDVPRDTPSTVDSGFDVDVFYVRAAKASRM
jgi:[ribosomal protein S5]-alanine N-acetyltransferase